MELQLAEDLINKLNVPQIIDIRSQLPVNPNYTWEQLTGGERDLNDLTTVGWHHDALAKVDYAGLDDLTMAQRIARAHINLKANEPQGDAGFPYHIWIRNGKAYLCNNLLAFTYGIASNNAYVVHVCVSGQYLSSDLLTDADRKMLMAVTIQLSRDLPAYAGIKAHCELNPTSCPGYDHNRIRDDVAKLELQLKADADPAKTKQKCYLGAQQHLYLYDQYAKDPEKNKWLEGWMLDLEQFMRDKGMFFDK